MSDIPRTLHMQYFWQTLCEWQRANIEEWRGRNPDWELVFWDREPENLPEDIRRALDLAPTPRFRADIIRYWTILNWGGVYVDIDTRPVMDRNLDDLMAQLPAGCRGFVSRYRRPDMPDNYFIGGAAGSTFWEEALQHALQPDGWRRRNRYFGALNVFPDPWMNDYGIYVLDQDQVVEITSVEEYRELLDRPPLHHPSAYLKHYRTCAKKSLEFLGDYNERWWEENGPQGEVPPPDNQPVEPEPERVLLAMPNGDLLADPGKTPPETPDGYIRDTNDSHRFHPVTK